MTRSKVIKCKMIKFQRQYQQEELPSLGEICFRGNFVTVISCYVLRTTKWRDRICLRAVMLSRHKHERDTTRFEIKINMLN